MNQDKTIPYHERMITSGKEEVIQEEHMLLRKFKPMLLKRGLDDPINIETLHEHLRIAMMLELSTIPPYLCALYSIESGDTTKANYKEEFGDNAEAAYIIRSVMMEEMLHLTLAGNILNAVEGEIKINDAEYVPEYPTILPDSSGSFKVHLSKFSKDAILTFLRIEQPTPPEDAPKLHDYETIGQFYKAIRNLMIALEAEAEEFGKTIFTGKSELQIDMNNYYGGGGQIICVSNLDEAIIAIDLILEQGEGTETTIYDPDHLEFDQIREIAHYFKFNEIYEEQRYATCQSDPKEPPQGTRMDIRYDKVYNMGTDLKTRDFVTDELKSLSNEFNLLYRKLLDDLQLAFTGHQNEFITAVAEMYKLRYKAVELMRNPIPGKNVNAGPTFEYLSDEEIRNLA